jgi:hypothetical protein
MVMKKVIVFLGALLFVATLAFAADTKVYQVTGTIYLVKDGAIIVKMGDNKYEIKEDSATKVNGTLKQGAEVTVNYTMNATKIEVKEDKAADTTTKK